MEVSTTFSDLINSCDFRLDLSCYKVLFVSDARTGCYVVLCGEIPVTCAYEWGRETVE